MSNLKEKIDKIRKDCADWGDHTNDEVQAVIDHVVNVILHAAKEAINPQNVWRTEEGHEQLKSNLSDLDSLYPEAGIKKETEA